MIDPERLRLAIDAAYRCERPSVGNIAITAITAYLASKPDTVDNSDLVWELRLMLHHLPAKKARTIRRAISVIVGKEPPNDR